MKRNCRLSDCPDLAGWKEQLKKGEERRNNTEQSTIRYTQRTYGFHMDNLQNNNSRLHI